MHTLMILSGLYNNRMYKFYIIYTNRASQELGIRPLRHLPMFIFSTALHVPGRADGFSRGPMGWAWGKDKTAKLSAERWIG